MDNKTAVEWLIDKHFGGIENVTPDFKKHIEQAKEMEKEQIAKAFDRGRFWNMSWDGNSYYEEIIIKGNNE
jgi:hypothetical protein